MRIILKLVSVFSFIVVAAPAFAHVTVTPKEVGVGKFQTFTVSVPVEKSMPTVGLRVVLPNGLEHVTPNVKSGWRIATKKMGTGEEAKITEIIWAGGLIPVDQRDEFLFSARVPATETELIWKAYQTYRDGTVVAWELDTASQPKNTEGEDDFSKSGPYSKTTVVNDLAGETEKGSGGSSSSALTFSIVALVFSVIALVRSRKNIPINTP